MNQIEWKDVPGYEGYYEINNIGQVRSLERIIEAGTFTRLLKGKVLKQRINKYGYLITDLSRNGVSKTFEVQRLMGLTFLQKLMDKNCVNHINGIKTDNRIENLNWMSHSENNVHAIKNGLKTYTKVLDVCTGVTYNSISDAAKHTQLSYSKLKRIFSLGQTNDTCLRLTA